MALKSEEAQREREVLTEFIETYRYLRCLWDTSDESYKNSKQKKDGWEALVQILKQIEPTANIATVKKKIENLKASYYRVVKKVKESKRAPGSTANNVPKPFLWYYDLMSFLNKKKHTKGAKDSQSCDDEDGKQTNRKIGTVDKEGNRLENEESDSNTETEHKSESNTFGIYVGEKLKQISSSQRDIAEKLISDVLFFAATNKLGINSCIETQYTHYNTDRHPPRYSPLPYMSHSGFSNETSLTRRSSSYFSSTPSPSLSIPVEIEPPHPSHHLHNAQLPTSPKTVRPPSSQYANIPRAVKIKKEKSDEDANNIPSKKMIKKEYID